MGIISTKLGLRVKELRENRKLTQLKLAELLDMEASNLSKIERGIQIPKEESLLKLSEALGVETKDLFDYEHFTDKKTLLKKIYNILENSDIEVIQKFYKILINL